MRRAFTFVELMIAASISAFLMATVVVVFSSIWTMAKNSTDELQLTLHARNIRERLLRKFDEKHDGMFVFCKDDVAYAPQVAAIYRNRMVFNLYRSDEINAVENPTLDKNLSFPGDFAYFKGLSAGTGDMFGKVYGSEFLPKNDMAGLPVARAVDSVNPIFGLVRANFCHQLNGSTYEDHPMLYFKTEGGVSPWKW